MAVSCCVAPTAKIDEEFGVSAMEVSGKTVKLTNELDIPANDALMLALPGVMPKASPDELITETLVFELTQFT
jgi:hypothetical protein